MTIKNPYISPLRTVFVRRIIASILFIATITVVGCNKEHIARGTPNCVSKKINNFSKTSCEGSANVKKYVLKGTMVFVFDQGDCRADMTSEVITADCYTLGYLGGITGNTKINGEEFSNAVFVKTIWEKKQ
jgi:hypothetical protein